MLEPPPGTATVPGLQRQARSCAHHGLEFVWLRGGGDPGDGHRALYQAAALAAGPASLRLIASVTAGGHPLRIAEEAAVTDNCCGGRLILALEGADPAVLGETVDVLLAALSGRPFAHVGPRWRIPARRAENENIPARITATPPPVQPELPIWLAGRAGAAVGRERCLSPVVGADGDPRSEWAQTETALGRAAARLRRPAVWPIDASSDGDFDDEALVARLCVARDAWGLDVAVLRLPRELDGDAREAATRRLAARVRPRVVLEALPAGLEDHWQTVFERGERSP